MKKIAIILCFVACGLYSLAQSGKPVQTYKLIGQGGTQAKNFYLLTLIENDAAVKHLLESDTALSAIATNKVSAIKNSLTACTDHSCFTQATKLSDEDIKTVSERLAALYAPNNALGKLVGSQLIASGTYIHYQDLTAKQLLVKAWELEAAGMNRVIGIYAEAMKPGYPDIDSIAFKVTAKSYNTLMYNASSAIADEIKKDKLFFEPSLRSALIFLDINGRKDAQVDEPMALTVNKAAVLKAKTIKWAKYKYSVILVPGAGPGESGMAISANGMLRCRIAAHRYFEGLAPFIMPSGGTVHPFKTQFCEADQMRKYMIESLHVPASVIIVEPQARHTTTNVRNGVRLLYRYGFPMSMACLCVTDKSQSSYIEVTMADRCMKELGYMPYKVGKRLSETDLEFYPLIESLQINYLEPLDP